MTDLQKLETALTELLSTHECVIIPNLGAFLLRSYPASANPFTGEIKPSGQTLFFNPAITSDDGLLLTHWRYNHGCDYTTANQAIQTLVDTITLKLKSNRSLALGKLGNFFLHNDGKYLFLPVTPLNLSKHAFGLAPIIFKDHIGAGSIHTRVELTNKSEVVREKAIPNTAEEIQEAEVVELKITRQKSYGFIWKIAASVCILGLSAAAVYFGKFSHKKQHVQLASSIPSAPTVTEKEEITTSANKKAVPFVSLLTEEGMNMGMEQIKSGQGHIFVCGGSYMSHNLAVIECNTWKKSGIPAVIGQKKGSSLVKVIIGRFENEKTASVFLESIPISAGYHAGLLDAQLAFE
ncbi:MAG: hypothetical protein FJ347_00105 [Sphingomonadales bacterium]|nr:hypothetical protein [Sphingomonadales bacterium]